MNHSTRYTKCGQLHIAYQVIGDGPLDLVYVPGWISNVEMMWNHPPQARFLERLASFSRLITFDKRGTGLSDAVTPDNLPGLEERMEDLTCVLDAAGSERAVLFGFSEGANLSAIFAATYPERTRALAMFGVFAKRIWSPDYPWAPKPADREAEYLHLEQNWGGNMDLQEYVPSKLHDKQFIRQLAAYFRSAASPTAAVTLLRMNTQIDIRDLLPVIQVPTLIMHRTGDRNAHVDEGRWMAGQIPGARFVELGGEDHIPWVGDQDALLDEVQEFATGVRPVEDFDRVLKTILFTDIVGSTEMAVALGDRKYKALLDRHHIAIRNVLQAYRGVEIHTTGDGFLVTFDGPGRAVKCAHALIDAVHQLGVEIRAGVHTGEVHLYGRELSGVAVHIAARVVDRASGGEVVVSRSVKDLTAGASIDYVLKETVELKGVPGQWELFHAIIPKAP